MYDRGAKGVKEMRDTKISTTDYKQLKRNTEYLKRSKRKKFRQMAINNRYGYWACKKTLK